MLVLLENQAHTKYRVARNHGTHIPLPLSIPPGAVVDRQQVNQLVPGIFDDECLHTLTAVMVSVVGVNAEETTTAVADPASPDYLHVDNSWGADDRESSVFAVVRIQTRTPKHA